MCSPMPDGLDGVDAPPCWRYPHCTRSDDCAWPECAGRHRDDDFSDAIKALARAFGPETEDPDAEPPV